MPADANIGRGRTEVIRIPGVGNVPLAVGRIPAARGGTRAAARKAGVRVVRRGLVGQ